ncbi:MAG TPA: hypothetical protein VNM22_11190 [Candidatus Limnocylindrales bacterium]|nr:hypothetical protein [Candidatus Limnocylindrales bacterium]
MEVSTTIRFSDEFDQFEKDPKFQQHLQTLQLILLDFAVMVRQNLIIDIRTTSPASTPHSTRQESN